MVNNKIRATFFPINFLLKFFALNLVILSIFYAKPTCAQKPWASPKVMGISATENAVNPSLDLIDILPPNTDQNISAWDWITDDKIVFTNWIWNMPSSPSGDIWVMEGLKSQDKSKISIKRYWSGNLREPLGVKVVNGEVYCVVKFALLKFIDANKDGIAEDTVQIVSFPHKQEPSETWNHYSMDLKYSKGFFYVALPSETVGAGFPGYPIMNGRGTVVKIDPVSKSLEYLITGLRTPDGLAWGPDSNLFVTDNQGAWLPSSKLIHVTGKRFFGLQPVEAGDPSLVESPPAIWMPHQEASSSPTQPMMLEKGPFAGQIIAGDNVLGFINRMALEKVKGEYQGALFHFTGGLTCGTHRLLQNANGDIFFGGLGSGINNWNVKGHTNGIQIAKFKASTNFEVKEIISRADGFTLRFTAPVGVSGEDIANYKMAQWHYMPTKDYGGVKIDNVGLTVTAASVDPSRTQVHLKVNGMLANRVIGFQFHRDIQSQKNEPLWTGEAWYTLNQISAETESFPTQINFSRENETDLHFHLIRNGKFISLNFLNNNFTHMSLVDINGKKVFEKKLNFESTVDLKGDLKPGIYFIRFENSKGNGINRKFVLN